MFRNLSCVLVLMLFTGTAVSAQESRPTELRVGLVPAISPQDWVERFSSMVTYLERRLGIDVVLVGAPNYAEFIRRAAEGGHYDLLLSGSDIYRYLDQKAGYRAIVRLEGAGNYALIAVPADSGLETLSDLAGKTIATADPLSLSRRLGENTLGEAGIIFGENAEVLVTPTQNASIASILSGLADAAIFMDPVLRRATPEVATKVKVIAESDRAVSHPFSVAPTLPENFVQELQSALVEMPESPEGVTFFAAIKWPHFIATQPDDYISMDWAVDAIERQLSVADSN